MIELKTVILELALLSTCLIGDYILKYAVAKQQYVVAIGDSLTHGTVAGLSWAIVCDAKTRQDIVQCLVCLLMAMCVDADHFLAAGSFSLNAALSLPTRPPFHASTVIVIVDVILLFLAAIMRWSAPVQYGVMFTVAWLSHHVRDGVRRGMWFYPFGSTPPLPRLLYLGIIVTLPLVAKWIYIRCKFKMTQTVINLDISSGV